MNKQKITYGQTEKKQKITSQFRKDKKEGHQRHGRNAVYTGQKKPSATIKQAVCYPSKRRFLGFAHE